MLRTFQGGECMRIYMAGKGAAGAEEAVLACGDTPVNPGRLVRCLDEKLRMVLRLAALGRCQAILLPAGWRDDPEAVLEKEFADFQGIPEVLYFLPGKGRCC